VFFVEFVTRIGFLPNMRGKSMPTKFLRAAIVGGGIGGLTAANSLVRRGVDVTIFEQADVVGEVGAGVFLYPNGLRQLERMGLGRALAEVGAKVGSDSEYYRMDGAVVGKILTTDSSGWNGIYGMHRADLLRVLAEALPPTSIRTGHRCVGFEC
jgi:salicylate hydroxylase